VNPVAPNTTNTLNKKTKKNQSRYLSFSIVLKERKRELNLPISYFL
jgi:hypothetical protein